MPSKIATSLYTDATIDAAIAGAHARIEHIMQVRGKMNGHHTHDMNNVKEIASAIGFLMKRAKHDIQSPEDAAVWLANKRFDRAHDVTLAAERQAEGVIAIDSFAQALGIYPVMEKTYNNLSIDRQKTRTHAFLAPEQLAGAETKAISLVEKAFAARGRMGTHLHNLDNMRAAVRYTFASLKTEIAKGTLASLEQTTESLAQRMRQTVEEIDREKAESLAEQMPNRERKIQERFYDMQRAECYVVMNSIAESLGIRQSFQTLCGNLAPAGAAR